MDYARVKNKLKMLRKKNRQLKRKLLTQIIDNTEGGAQIVDGDMQDNLTLEEIAISEPTSSDDVESDETPTVETPSSSLQSKQEQIISMQNFNERLESIIE